MQNVYHGLSSFSRFRRIVVLVGIMFLVFGYKSVFTPTWASSEEEGSNNFEEEDVFERENVFDEESSSKAASIGNATISVINGFVEIERGARIGGSEGHAESWILANERVRLKTSGNNDKGGFDLKLDFVNDGITHQTKVDIREARLRYSPMEWMDLSVGRQISTWGVGDLIFINDLFPKNWVSMFTGQDMELLKDPTNVVRVTIYASSWTWDIVWTPEFTPDSTPNGCRFSIFNPNANNPSNQQTFGKKTIGIPEACLKSSLVAEQNNQLENGEIAMRLKRQWGSQEVALYGYNGFWKSPKGMRLNPSTGLLEPFYPRKGAYGFSSEGQWGPGIFFFETGHYLSYEDQDGTDPLIENSLVRLLLGYKFQVTATQSIGTQMMSEKMLNYNYYKDHLLPGQTEKMEIRNTYTLRLTQTAQQETLRMSIFVYHRPEDHDNYLRYWLNKRLDDHFEIAVGGNVFSGDTDYLESEFGMLHQDDNTYARLKYVF